MHVVVLWGEVGEVGGGGLTSGCAHGLMGGTHTNSRNPPRYSAISLALFEDSGWYQANYSRAGKLDWGHQMGCPFPQVLPRTAFTVPLPGDSRSLSAVCMWLWGGVGKEGCVGRWVG